MADVAEIEDTDFCWSYLSNVLIKGVVEGSDWMVYLEASNENLDQDEEVVLQKALMDNKDYYLQNGVVSYDHLHSRGVRDPGMVIGEPIDVKFNLNTRSTLVKGRLYEKNENAIKVWNNLQSRARYGASVGGGILSKSKGMISKLVWADTAITPSPVNSTVKGNVQMGPFKEFCKSLMAGSGVDAAAYTGGRALTPESTRRVFNNRKDKPGEYMHLDLSDETDDPRITYGMYYKLFTELLYALNKKEVTSWEQVSEWISKQCLPEDIALQVTGFIAKNIPGLK